MITIVLIIFTCIISIKAFKDDGLMEKWIFYPPAVKHGEWQRLFTYGFLHADFTHLIFNMFTLYFFGVDIEKYCIATLGELTGSVAYIVLYFSALFVSIFPTYLKERDNDYYHGLGASGAVSAIIFAYQPYEFYGGNVHTGMAACFPFCNNFCDDIGLSEQKPFGGNKSLCAHCWWYLRYCVYDCRVWRT